uniref:Uncharacterized protein n=1 Tax=Octopus bimaculoides TaxID=37653 RepID=A0A0L8FF19_OCTBM
MFLMSQRVLEMYSFLCPKAILKYKIIFSIYFSYEKKKCLLLPSSFLFSKGLA